MAIINLVVTLAIVASAKANQRLKTKKSKSDDYPSVQGTFSKAAVLDIRSIDLSRQRESLSKSESSPGCKLNGKSIGSYYDLNNPLREEEPIFKGSNPLFSKSIEDQYIFSYFPKSESSGSHVISMDARQLDGRKSRSGASFFLKFELGDDQLCQDAIFLDIGGKGYLYVICGKHENEDQSLTMLNIDVNSQKILFKKEVDLDNPLHHCTKLSLTFIQFDEEEDQFIFVNTMDDSDSSLERKVYVFQLSQSEPTPLHTLALKYPSGGSYYSASAVYSPYNELFLVAAFTEGTNIFMQKMSCDWTKDQNVIECDELGYERTPFFCLEIYPFKVKSEDEKYTYFKASGYSKFLHTDMGIMSSGYSFNAKVRAEFDTGSYRKGYFFDFKGDLNWGTFSVTNYFYQNDGYHSKRLIYSSKRKRGSILDQSCSQINTTLNCVNETSISAYKLDFPGFLVDTSQIGKKGGMMECTYLYYSSEVVGLFNISLYEDTMATPKIEADFYKDLYIWSDGFEEFDFGFENILKGNGVSVSFENENRKDKNVSSVVFEDLDVDVSFTNVNIGEGAKMIQFVFNPTAAALEVQNSGNTERIVHLLTCEDTGLRTKVCTSYANTTVEPDAYMEPFSRLYNYNLHLFFVKNPSNNSFTMFLADWKNGTYITKTLDYIPKVYESCQTVKNSSHLISFIQEENSTQIIKRFIGTKDSEGELKISETTSIPAEVLGLQSLCVSSMTCSQSQLHIASICPANELFFAENRIIHLDLTTDTYFKVRMTPLTEEYKNAQICVFGEPFPLKDELYTDYTNDPNRIAVFDQETKKLSIVKTEMPEYVLEYDLVIWGFDLETIGGFKCLNDQDQFVLHGKFKGEKNKGAAIFFWGSEKIGNAERRVNKLVDIDFSVVERVEFFSLGLGSLIISYQKDQANVDVRELLSKPPALALQTSNIDKEHNYTAKMNLVVQSGSNPDVVQAPFNLHLMIPKPIRVTPIHKFNGTTGIVDIEEYSSISGTCLSLNVNSPYNQTQLSFINRTTKLAPIDSGGLDLEYSFMAGSPKLGMAGLKQGGCVFWKDGKPFFNRTDFFTRTYDGNFSINRLKRYDSQEYDDFFNAELLCKGNSWSGTSQLVIFRLNMTDMTVPNYCFWDATSVGAQPTVKSKSFYMNDPYRLMACYLGEDYRTSCEKLYVSDIGQCSILQKPIIGYNVYARDIETFYKVIGDSQYFVFISIPLNMTQIDIGVYKTDVSGGSWKLFKSYNWTMPAKVGKVFKIKALDLTEELTEGYIGLTALTKGAFFWQGQINILDMENQKKSFLLNGLRDYIANDNGKFFMNKEYTGVTLNKYKSYADTIVLIYKNSFGKQIDESYPFTYINGSDIANAKNTLSENGELTSNQILFTLGSIDLNFGAYSEIEKNGSSKIFFFNKHNNQKPFLPYEIGNFGVDIKQEGLDFSKVELEFMGDKSSVKIGLDHVLQVDGGNEKILKVGEEKGRFGNWSVLLVVCVCLGALGVLGALRVVLGRKKRVGGDEYDGVLSNL